MTNAIDLGSLLPENIKLEPLFESREDLESFEERYRQEVQPKLKEHEAERRRSEEEARHRYLS